MLFYFLTTIFLFFGAPRNGWYVFSQKGSHIQLKHPEKIGRVTVPNHGLGKEVDIKTEKSILKQAGIRRRWDFFTRSQNECYLGGSLTLLQFFKRDIQYLKPSTIQIIIMPPLGFVHTKSIFAKHLNQSGSVF